MSAKMQAIWNPDMGGPNLVAWYGRFEPLGGCHSVATLATKMASFGESSDTKFVATLPPAATAVGKRIGTSTPTKIDLPFSETICRFQKPGGNLFWG